MVKKSIKKTDKQKGNKIKKSVKKFLSKNSKSEAVIKKEKTEKVKKKKPAKIEEKVVIEEKEKDSYLTKWVAPEFIINSEERVIYYAGMIISIIMVLWHLLYGEIIVMTTFFLLAVVVAFNLYRKPRDIEYKIDLDGIYMDESLFQYDKIASFEVVHKEEADILKFKLRNDFLPVKTVYLIGQNPHYIRALLEHFLPEEKQEESLISFERKKNGEGNFSEDNIDEYE